MIISLTFRVYSQCHCVTAPNHAFLHPLDAGQRGSFQVSPGLHTMTRRTLRGVKIGQLLREEMPLTEQENAMARFSGTKGYQMPDQESCSALPARLV